MISNMMLATFKNNLKLNKCSFHTINAGLHIAIVIYDAKATIHSIQHTKIIIISSTYAQTAYFGLFTLTFSMFVGIDCIVPR